ncbi:hypothetical protein Bca52824_082721 [Brassica carinata]|uniref:Uncharacterized protein n=1 Tax=Brassica carinata TaxID=52824 RepID=A0A8X7TS70_BRACI|nr:hypothetical protein Bca52824_082721 [Brassica carinata]
MVDTGATHNFMATDEAVRLGVKWSKKDGWMKTRPGELLRHSHGRFQGSLGYGLHETSLSHTHACIELGLHPRRVHRMIPTLEEKIDGTRQLSAMQLTKGVKKGEPTFLAMMKVEDEPNNVEDIPQVIKTVLEENKDVMPAKSSWSQEPNHHLWRLIEWLHPN